MRQLLSSSISKIIHFLVNFWTLCWYQTRLESSPIRLGKEPLLIVAHHTCWKELLIAINTFPCPVTWVTETSQHTPFYRRLIHFIYPTIEVGPYDHVYAFTRSLRAMKKVLRKGGVLLIPPGVEGAHMDVLKKGLTCTIVPLEIKKEKKNRLCIHLGPPLFQEAQNISDELKELEYVAWMEKKKSLPPLRTALISSLRKHPFKEALFDEILGSFSQGKTLLCACALASKLGILEERVGILLPTSSLGVLANMAVCFRGKTSINLNYSTGEQGVEYALKAANIKTVLTAQKFLEKTQISLPEGVRPLFIETLLKNLLLKDKLYAFYLAFIAQETTLDDIFGTKDRDQPLGILFTSGSTTEPKGVMLSEFNVLSNAFAVSEILPSNLTNQKILSPLPFFHAFGSMIMWKGLLNHFSLVLVPNPLDMQAIATLTEKTRPSIMLSVPTFLQGLLKKAQPKQLQSLEFLLTGAEKLPESLANAFQQRFGILPVEGYGATECSPVIATSTSNHKKEEFIHFGYKKGSCGKTIPGVVAKVVHPDTFEDLPKGEVGLLLCKGPNIMEGYLDRPDLTAKVKKGPWYITGDLALIDAEGFIHIKDRLARFTKIGGEMVSHTFVEDTLHKLSQAPYPTFAVTDKNDPKKGSKLAVIHTFDKDKLVSLLEEMRREGVPNLMIPKPDAFIAVEDIPRLGSGKLDLKKLKELAREHQKNT